MPRYFFHLKNDTTVVLDEEGLFLPNVEAMRAEVTQSVREIISEPKFAHHDFWGQELEIADEHGKTVMVVPCGSEADIEQPLSDRHNGRT